MMTGKESGSSRTKKKRKKEQQSNPFSRFEADYSELFRHLTKVSLTMVVHLLLDYLYALLYLVFSIYI